MNILYIGSFRLPCFDAAASRVLNVSRALRAGGHCVSFVSWGGKRRSEDLNTNGEYVYDGFPYVITDEIDFNGGVFGKLKGWIKQGSRTKEILKERLGKYDAIIAYNCSIIRWLIPFCKKNGVKLVTDITEWYEYNEQKPIMWPGYAWDMCYYQKRVKNKIVISQYLNKYYSSSHNVVIPATCDASEGKWLKGEDKFEELSASFDGVTLIYAGNPARKDAVHYVIKAVNTLANEGAKIRFLIVGITKEQYVERYKKMLKGIELDDAIKFLGRVSQDEVPSYYALSDFMVLLREPNRKSNAGFPTKFSESFISGTPVIANITSDLGNYLKDGETGFIVSEPREEAIYQTLKEKVLSLSKIEIEEIKSNVRKSAKQLDYRSYIEPLRVFMSNLK